MFKILTVASSHCWICVILCYLRTVNWRCVSRCLTLYLDVRCCILQPLKMHTVHIVTIGHQLSTLTELHQHCSRRLSLLLTMLNILQTLQWVGICHVQLQQQQQQQHPFNGHLSVTTRVSQYQKGKTSLDLLEQEILSGSGISWATCKSAPRPRQVTTPASHHPVFYRPDALPAAQQQSQSTEGNLSHAVTYLICLVFVSFVVSYSEWFAADMYVVCCSFLYVNYNILILSICCYTRVDQ